MKKHINVYTFCVIITLIIFAAFTARLVDWQLINSENYRGQAYADGAEEIKSEPVRGQIFDKDGKGLIVNQTRYRVVVRGTEIDGNEKQIFPSLINLFDKLKLAYYKDIPDAVPDGETYIFADNIKSESAGAVAENLQKINGASVEPYLVRTAESPNLAPHILGALGAVTADEYESGDYALNDKTGKFGIEAKFETELRGKSGEKLVLFDGGSAVSEELKQSAERGSNIWLTLDSKLQKTAAESLAENVQAAKAEGKAESEIYSEKGRGEDCSAGAAVMLSVKDFSVLAAASYPTYDLNKYSLYGDYYSSLANDENSPMFNRAFDGEFACGSVFKPCVALAALESGAIDESTQFFCDKFYDYYPSNIVECMHYHGMQDIYSATAHSCNWFYAEAGRRAGIKNICACAEKLGLGVKTGLETGESGGVLAGRNDDDWQPGDTPRAAIGQSDNAFTPLQLAAYTATLANNGTRLKTHLVGKITSADNSKIIADFTKPETAESSSFSEKNLKIVQKAMREVASNPEGTAYSVFGDYKTAVAAKTGTAENSGSDHAVFICYAPFEKPEVAVAVVIENGVRGKYAMQVAKDLLDGYFK